MTELHSNQRGSQRRIIDEEELRQFAWDVYYKAITLVDGAGKHLIDFDEEIVKELSKTLVTERRNG